ncbi:MAG TPA: glycosyltransferase family 4 protein [Myxococcota bacterium]|nr:glycosyltransferase family 4 protein [Myxococcota bacterium]
MQAARPLAVAHVTGETGFSGGEVQLFLLLEGLRARGDRSLLICPPGSRVEAESRRRGFETRAVRMRSDLSAFAALRIRAALRAFGPDLVHLHSGRANWLGGLAAWSLDLPALTTRRMDRAVHRGARTRFLYERVTRRAVAISPAVRERLLAGGVAPERIRVIPSAVDARALTPTRSREAVRKDEALPEGAVCALALAALVPRKGLDVAIDALAEPSLRELPLVLWLAGDGAERAALESRAAARGVAARVRFLGRREDRADLLSASDLLVLPSRREGLGVAALEAMACARAVVASRVGGLADAVAHEATGLLVPPDEPKLLAAALARLVRDPALRARLGAAGPARVAAHFSPPRMCESYAALYRELLAEAGR